LVSSGEDGGELEVERDKMVVLREGGRWRLTVIDARPSECTRRDMERDGEGRRCCGWWSTRVCITSTDLVRMGCDMAASGGSL
jgi:hypothetical protein